MKSLLFVVLISLFGCGLSNSQTTKKSEVTSLQMSVQEEIDGYVKNFSINIKMKVQTKLLIILLV